MGVLCMMRRPPTAPSMSNSEISQTLSVPGRQVVIVVFSKIKFLLICCWHNSKMQVCKMILAEIQIWC